MLACASAGFAPDIAHYADEWDTGLSLIAYGFGVCLIPRMARIHGDWDVTRVPLSGKTQPSRRILSLTRMGARKQPTIMAALELIEARVASMFAPEWTP